jgi:hypothetical protein
MRTQSPIGSQPWSTADQPQLQPQPLVTLPSRLAGGERPCAVSVAFLGPGGASERGGEGLCLQLNKIGLMTTKCDVTAAMLSVRASCTNNLEFFLRVKWNCTVERPLRNKRNKGAGNTAAVFNRISRNHVLASDEIVIGQHLVSGAVPLQNNSLSPPPSLALSRMAVKIRSRQLMRQETTFSDKLRLG